MIRDFKNKVVKKFSPSSSRRSSESASSRDNMSIDSCHRGAAQEDTPPPVPRGRAPRRIRVLTSVEQIVPQNYREREALELLKNHTYHHVRVFDNHLMMKTGLTSDMNRAFGYKGWDSFAHITESGSKFLTMEFLMSLSLEETPKSTLIHFRFFGEQFVMTARELSIALKFDKKCVLDPDSLVKDRKYDRTTWWNEISEEPVRSKNSIVSLHNPTLRMLAKWMGMVVHPRSDLRLCSSVELQYLFAMAHKIKIFQVWSMVAHWQKMIVGKGPIDMTSLVTRIATHVKALDDAQVTYLPWDYDHQPVVGVEHFMPGHMMREGPGYCL